MSDSNIKLILQMVNHASIVAWESLASSVLPVKSRRYRISKESKLFNFSNSSSFFKDFCEEHHYLAKNNPIIGWVTDSQQDIEKTQELFSEIYKRFRSKNALHYATAETLAKVLAYRNLKVKTTIDFPSLIAPKKQFSHYRVDRIFNLWKEMRAFGLICEDRSSPPILLFRGTDFSLLTNSSRISIVSNFDPAGPGFTIYKYARRSIKNWLTKTTEQYGKAISVGYSLGGALASYALLKDPDYFSQEHPSYLFNHPGLSSPCFEEWQASSLSPIKAFVSDGDVVSKYGFLYGETYAIKHASSPAPIKAHTMLHFLQPRVRLNKIDLSKENEAPSRKIYSKLHKNTANVFFNVGLKLLFPVF
ncbi:MAG: DUF2974 domain-containing protein [Simkaniaceae bacterium]|nr:DUF2974 domain-containing protein [Simkaniaceae bacterium]MCF7852254.1 DUF2974 domain-containing protein [Simkaniaceae bacterium]